MKTTIKLAAISALALAVSSTSTFALPELPAGATTGLALGAALPEGVYAISQESYGTAQGAQQQPFLCYSGLADLVDPVADRWRPYRYRYRDRCWLTLGNASHACSHDSFLNTLVEGSIAWNLRNGFNVSARAGAWLPSTQAIPTLLSSRLYRFPRRRLGQLRC